MWASMQFKFLSRFKENNLHQAKQYKTKNNKFYWWGF